MLWSRRVAALRRHDRLPVAAGVAAADSARVRWRGVAVEGRAPAALQPAVAAHVAVALRSLGSSLVTSGPGDAEAAASCAFPSSAKVARCVVVVQVGRATGGRAERRAEIRYRDAEDLAESLALLVAEHPDLGVPRRRRRRACAPQSSAKPAAAESRAASSVADPDAAERGASPSTDDARAAPSARDRDAAAARDREITAAAGRRCPRAREHERQATARRRSRRSCRRRRRLTGEIGAVGVFGLGPANPIARRRRRARSLFARAVARRRFTVARRHPSDCSTGHDLTFLRVLVAARAGVGFARRRRRLRSHRRPSAARARRGRA